MSSEAKRTWGWIAAAVGVLTAISLALGWYGDAKATGAQQATIELRVQMLEKGAEATRGEIREIRQDQTAIRRTLDRLCAVTPGCRE